MPSYGQIKIEFFDKFVIELRKDDVPADQVNVPSISSSPLLGFCLGYLEYNRHDTPPDSETGIDKSATFEKTATIDESATIDNSTVLEKMAIVDEIATFDEPATFDKSTAFDKTATFDELAIFDKPATDEITDSNKPAAFDEPATLDKSAIFDEKTGVIEKTTLDNSTPFDNIATTDDFSLKYAKYTNYYVFLRITAQEQSIRIVDFTDATNTEYIDHTHESQLFPWEVADCFPVTMCKPFSAARLFKADQLGISDSALFRNLPAIDVATELRFSRLQAYTVPESLVERLRVNTATDVTSP